MMRVTVAVLLLAACSRKSTDAGAIPSAEPIPAAPANAVGADYPRQVGFAAPAPKRTGTVKPKAPPPSDDDDDDLDDEKPVQPRRPGTNL
jgi:hypothetical protein